MSLPPETLSLLQNVPLFTGLSNYVLARHLGRSRRILTEGQTPRSLEDPSGSIYIVLSGYLRANESGAADGTFPMFRAGEAVSEISLPGRHDAFDHLLASPGCELLCVDLATIELLANDSPQAASNLLGMVSAGITFSKRSSHQSENQQGYAGLDYIDELTGLHNGQWMVKTFERQIQRSFRSHDSSVLMLIRIDQFERYNQAHGSLGGDQALRTIAQTILTCLRPNDLAARHFGEVFAVLMPHTTPEEAQIASQRLAAQAGKADIVTPTGDALPNVTVSIGLAEVREDRTLQQLLELAGAAMQQPA